MQQNRVIIIGAVGRYGSGKDEVLKYLKDKHNIPFVSTGDLVREIAGKEGLEPTRENLGKISERYFRELGPGCFVKMLAARLRQSNLKIAGISGIRSLEDIRILKETCGKDFILIRVDVSDPHLRFQRMTRRHEARDPRSYEQFLTQEASEEQLFHVGDAEKMADYTIDNDGSLDDLHSQIDRWFEQAKLPSD